MRLVMMGTGSFGLPTLRWLAGSPHDLVAVITQPPRPAVGRRPAGAGPIRQAAEQLGIAPVAMADVNASEAHRQLRSYSPELFVVCDFGQILSDATLAIPQRGGINLHGSLLPKYRGAAPVQWALYHGETVTGVTVIHMSPKLDAGPILSQRELAIEPDETAPELHDRLAQLGVDAVRESIELLAAWDGRSPIGRPQDPALATRAPRLKKQDGLVDWSRTARQIRNQVRAFKPWPGTFTYWHRSGRAPLRLILDGVSVVDEAAAHARPGRVIDCSARHVHVATGGGTLALQHVQPAGKRIMAIDEFLRGYRVGPTDWFGPERADG